MPRLYISLSTPIKNIKFLDTTEQITFNMKLVYCTILERDDVKTRRPLALLACQWAARAQWNIETITADISRVQKFLEKLTRYDKKNNISQLSRLKRNTSQINQQIFFLKWVSNKPGYVYL